MAAATASPKHGLDKFLGQGDSRVYGNFELVKAYPDTGYPDGTLGDVFFFES